MTRSLAEPNSRLAKAPIMGARSSRGGVGNWANLPVSDRQFAHACQREPGAGAAAPASRRLRRRPRPLVGGRRCAFMARLLHQSILGAEVLMLAKLVGGRRPAARSRSARGAQPSSGPGGQEASPGEDPVVAIVDGAPVHRSRARGGGARAARAVPPDADADALRHAARPGDRLPPARRRGRAAERRRGSRRSRPRWPRRAPTCCATLLVQQTIEQGPTEEKLRALYEELSRPRKLRAGRGACAPHPAAERGRGQGGDRGARRAAPTSPTLAKERSVDGPRRRPAATSASSSREQMVPEFAEAAFALEPGEITDGAGPDPVRLARHQGASSGAPPSRPSTRAQPQLRQELAREIVTALVARPARAAPRSSASTWTARRCRTPEARAAAPAGTSAAARGRAARGRGSEGRGCSTAAPIRAMTAPARRWRPTRFPDMPADRRACALPPAPRACAIAAGRI